VWAQTDPNLRVKNILLTSDTLVLDTMPIIPGTVYVNAGVERADYMINYGQSQFINLKFARMTELQVTYRVMSLQLTKPFRHKDISLLQPEFTEIRNPFLYTPSGDNKELFARDGLRMNGNLSRGLAFGNNQDIVVNSNLNLQMAGKLGNDIAILAAISDENNPIQPEGNTQQLQDFDRVFIQISKDNTRLIVGDFEMNRPEDSYFMNYYKKSRGGQIQSTFNVHKNGKLHVLADAAISRGRFTRNIINGIEGNQGPYRLTGNNGETFIIIISGTEAVYLDGEKLTRGEQHDYVIDYNSGEIIFMPRKVITQYSRIVVEFQFSDRNYARSVFHLQSTYEEKKYRIRANYFTEQDNKNQPFLQNLTDSNKMLLASVGDRLNEALAPSEVATNSFSINRILYVKRDTMGFSNIYRHATEQGIDTVFYEVRFSFVGANKGNYRLGQTAANGRVFEWVAPIDGVRQGDYEPVVLLVSPKQIQMYSLGGDWMPNEHTKISAEYARSENDINMYSNIDKANDGGNAFRLNIVNETFLGNKKTTPWSLKSDLNYEYTQAQFRYIERYRNVEFDRIWNRQLINQPTADTGFLEHIIMARTTLKRTETGNLFYQFGYYDRVGTFSGIQHQIGTSLKTGKYKLIADGEQVSTKTQDNKTAGSEVMRFQVDGGRSFYNFFAGAKWQTEQSEFRKANDTLLNGSYAYQQYGFYLRNNDSSQTNYKLEYNERDDYRANATDYTLSTKGRTATAEASLMQRNMNRLSASATYREFQILDTFVSGLLPEKTILSRIEYDYSFLKRVFSANTYYQIGSGNELRRDFQYLEVQPGQGQYVWKDFNGDGIPTLNEFLLASINDRIQANYIRVFLPTTSNIRVNTNQFNQTLNINPAAIWNNKKGFKKQLAKWNNQTAFRLDRKTSDLELTNFLNPFSFNLNDSQIISNASVIRNTLFFNRTDPTFGFDLNFSDNRSKNFLTNGFDARARREQGTNIRWNFTTAWGITLGYNFGTRSYASDFFTANNYNYQFDEWKPRLIWQASKNIRITGVFTYFKGYTAESLGNIAGENLEYGGELRYSLAKNGIINAKYSFYNVKFNGDIASPLGYDMMQGFVIGENQMWNISFQQRLGGNVQVSVNYDGRKAENSDIIHIGRMEARYVF
jgi:hypothetical protein